ncbi:MAG TPA: NifB/NifX family molybdenum-iron cluster-binding protein [Candidatus Aminicenantes bacterium]|nr:NifB/NifX family molybdenum-iron cluster-binding protein [Candidatus Aminicenantes bacterium]
MKIAFSATSDSLDAALDPRFGRAKGFLVVDLDQDRSEFIDNHQNLNAAQGAGIQAAETVSRSGAGALVTGHCGPKAFRALAASGIRIYHTDATTVAEALARYREGKLVEVGAADVEGHWV